MADRGFPAGLGPSASGWSRTGTVLGAAAAALGAAALYNGYRSRQVERRHPPTGRFVEVDGVRLHYLERGAGTPVVLIHGNVVTAEDWVLSGVLDQVAAQGHQVIALSPWLRLQRPTTSYGVDRRGAGRSSPPRLRASRHRAPGGGRPLL